MFIGPFQWGTLTVTLAKSATLKPIDTKFWTIDYIGEISGCAKNLNNRFHEAPHNTRNITFRVLFVSFLRSYIAFLYSRRLPRVNTVLGSRTARTGSPRWSMMVQKTCFRCRTAFLSPANDLIRKGWKSPKNCQKFDPQKGIFSITKFVNNSSLPTLDTDNYERPLIHSRVVL